MTVKNFIWLCLAMSHCSIWVKCSQTSISVYKNKTGFCRFPILKNCANILNITENLCVAHRLVCVQIEK